MANFISNLDALPSDAFAAYFEALTDRNDISPEEIGLADCGLNADWNCSAYHMAGECLDGLGLYVLDNEDGTFSLVTREYSDDGDNDEIEEEGTFDRLIDALDAAIAHPIATAEIEAKSNA
jgi:hypothetical protein